MARNKTDPIVNFDALRTTLLNSKLQKDNPAAFQVINQLLDMLKLNNTQIDNKFLGLESIKNSPFLMWKVSDLPNSKALFNVILRGDRADQPDANTVPVGTLYYVVDETLTERSSGSAWESYKDV